MVYPRAFMLAVSKYQKENDVVYHGDMQAFIFTGFHSGPLAHNFLQAIMHEENTFQDKRITTFSTDVVTKILFFFSFLIFCQTTWVSLTQLIFFRLSNAGYTLYKSTEPTFEKRTFGRECK